MLFVLGQSLDDGHPMVGVDREAPIFAVIGETGVGKSSFINSLGGRSSSNDAPEICDTLDTCTNEILVYKATVDNLPIYLMDTPGFNDRRMTDEEVMNMIYQKLNTLYNDGRPVRGLVYLYDISRVRFGGLAAKVGGLQVQAFDRLELNQGSNSWPLKNSWDKTVSRTWSL